jgi:NRPS condensation-like uncharacterized protein
MSQRIQATASDIAIFCGRENIGAMHIHATFIVEGSVDIERFKKAVQISIEVEPVLGCRFVTHPIRPRWEPQPELKREAFLERYCCAVEGMNLQAKADAFLAEPLDPAVDPLIQIRVFRQLDNAQEIIVFKLSHVVGDGSGLYFYIQSVVKIYAKLSQDPSYKPTGNPSSRGFDQITKQFSNNEKLQIVWSALKYRSRITFLASRWGFPNPSMPAEQRMFVRKEIPPEQVQALRKYGRKQGATLNLVLLTAYFRSLCANIPNLGQGSLPLGTTIDLRRYVPEAQRSQMPLCNLSGLIVLLIEASPGNFAETLALITKSMKERKANNHLGLGVVPFFLSLYTGLPYFLSEQITRIGSAKAKKRQTTTPVLSNSGEIKAEDFEFGDVKIVNIYVLSLVAYSPSFFSSVSEFRQTITLATGFCQTLIPRATVEAIFEDMARELSKLAEKYIQGSMTNRH